MCDTNCDNTRETGGRHRDVIIIFARTLAYKCGVPMCIYIEYYIVIGTCAQSNGISSEFNHYIRRV